MPVDTQKFRHYLGTTYHHSSWLGVLARTYPQMRVAAIGSRNSDGSLHAALPFAIVRSRLGTRFVSMCFTPYCDPLVMDQDEFRMLLRPLLQSVGAGARYELRVLHSTATMRRA
jgi:hypothetical protein